MCEINEYLELIKQFAEEMGVGLTENAERIANFRKRANIPMNVCPCHKDNPYRGCISQLCMKEIQERGVCGCNCFKKIQ